MGLFPTAATDVVVGGGQDASKMASFEKQIVIDGRGHLMGHLASIVAKQLCMGQHIVVVRCEELLFSGSFYRNKLKFKAYLRKHVNSNRARGPFHFRAPSRMLYKVIRGMTPHKTKRGAEALSHLKVFEGVPPEYQNKKRMVVPAALRVIRLKPNRKTFHVGRLAHEVGWKYQDIVQTLEAKRKARSAEYYA